MDDPHVVVGRNADGSEERWETHSLGSGLSIIGSPEKGYRLSRKPHEQPLVLSGLTIREATRDAMIRYIAAPDEDALFGKRPPLPAPEPKRGFVYFIAGEVGLVKIGFAAKPEQRLRDLQCGSPIELRILATVEGMSTSEREYHKRFAAYRRHREWFERCPEIEAEIERLSNGNQ